MKGWILSTLITLIIIGAIVSIITFDLKIILYAMVGLCIVILHIAVIYELFFSEWSKGG